MHSVQANRTTLVACVVLATLPTAAWLSSNGVREPVKLEAAAAPAALERRAPPPAASPAGVSVKTIANKKLVAGSEPQRLILTGSGFEPGMAARLITPDGLIISYEPTSVEHVSVSIFGLTVPLEKPGTYLLRVRNVAGATSNDIKFEVGR